MNIQFTQAEIANLQHIDMNTKTEGMNDGNVVGKMSCTHEQKMGCL